MGFGARRRNRTISQRHRQDRKPPPPTGRRKPTRCPPMPVPTPFRCRDDQRWKLMSSPRHNHRAILHGPPVNTQRALQRGSMLPPSGRRANLLGLCFLAARQCRKKKKSRAVMVAIRFRERPSFSRTPWPSPEGPGCGPASLTVARTRLSVCCRGGRRGGSRLVFESIGQDVGIPGHHREVGDNRRHCRGPAGDDPGMPQSPFCGEVGRISIARSTSPGSIRAIEMPSSAWILALALSVAIWRKSVLLGLETRHAAHCNAVSAGPNRQIAALRIAGANGRGFARHSGQ